MVKGAFPEYRVQQGLDQLIHLYTLAGFSGKELTAISSRILDLHRNSEKGHVALLLAGFSGLFLFPFFFLSFLVSALFRWFLFLVVS